MVLYRKSEVKSASENILDVLFENKEPLNLYKISKLSKLSHQTVKYTITNLIKKGLILPVNTSNGTRYSVQKIFHSDDQIIKSVLNSIEPFVDAIHPHLNLEYAEDIKEALANNVALLISRRKNELNR
jgi:predicted transcriptional regulator